jgi:hypothetical protein
MSDEPVTPENRSPEIIERPGMPQYMRLRARMVGHWNVIDPGQLYNPPLDLEGPGLEEMAALNQPTPGAVLIRLGYTHWRAHQ